MNNIDLFGLRLEGMPDIEADMNGSFATPCAFRTKSKTHARRAASENKLDEILPSDIADGDAWHVLSSGDIDSLSYLAHILKTHTLDYLAVSTWCMAMDDVHQFHEWLKNGNISIADFYVGEIFKGSYAKEYAELYKVINESGGRVAIFRNHSKIYLCKSGDRAWVIESSANINTNPRCEQTVITADMGLFLHHKSYFDGIRSFDRSFDDWTPA